ncbi:hypothetical protein TWF506_010621 [Arthrobotrys conoides]|uniref:Uncharacterized protein n=1 Tax=Arthrobotrys conoides TaxID=74498 RepID=A0AAN8NF84_9PEZI
MLEEITSRWDPCVTNPHIYTTPFDPIEKITHYYAATINPHIPQWSITSAATLPASSATYTPSQIKSAWKTLRYHHPIIAVTVSDDETGLVYKSPESLEEFEQWVEETVVIVSGDEDIGRKGGGREVLSYQKVPKTGEVYWIPERREVVLHLPHQISDGIGSIILLNNFLKILRTGETIPDSGFRREDKRLPPSLFDTLGGKDWRDGKNFGLKGEMLKTAKEIAGRFLGNESIAVSIKDGVGMDTVPELPYGRIEYEFDEEETERIVKACKDMGVTVTNAVMTANAFEMAKHGDDATGEGKKKKKKISNLVSVNYRPLIDGEERLQAGGNMFVDTFSVFEVEGDEGKKEFKQLAKEVKEELKKWKDNEDYISYTPLLVHRLEEAARKSVGKGDIGHSGFVVSSLGVVENYLKEEVDDFWFGISVASASAGCLFIWTVKGKLRIAICFNNAWFGEGVIEEFMNGLVGGLRSGLGV